MAYNELIKNFDRVRALMRDFYVYGFKTRSEYTFKSSRTYDDERRRLESWLGDYMKFSQSQSGKNLFLSIDSRACSRNPLYKAWKSAGFTDGDITLHFIIFDILQSPDDKLTCGQIAEKITLDYLHQFENAKEYDESTIRKKLKEYAELGLLHFEKQGKNVYYSRNSDLADFSADALLFASEIFPVGVVGSTLLDKQNTEQKDRLTFKHHYISQTMDSEILLSLLRAMQEHREVTLTNLGKRDSEARDIVGVPLKIFISTQSGRQYLIMCRRSGNKIISLRLDYILKVQPGEVIPGYDKIRHRLEQLSDHVWGVSGFSHHNRTMEHVEFVLRFEDEESHIPNRLEREKRCGKVELLDEHHCRFSADVYDSAEMLPWIRTFICRIESIRFSNAENEALFRKDLEEMYEMYGLSGGECL